MGFVTKALNKMGIRTGFMDWSEYSERMQILEDNHFQQTTRQHNVEIMPPPGAVHEEE